MNMPCDQIDTSEWLSVIEGVLDLCLKREREIEKLKLALEKAQNRSAAVEKVAARMAEAAGQNSTVYTWEEGGILIVDDSELMRNRMVDLLKRSGCKNILVADSGQMAIDIYRQRKPLVVAIDLEMPIMDGYEATRKIKELDPGARIIAISHAVDRAAILKALQAGATNFITTPLNIERFLQLVGRRETEDTPG
jgi:two-component system chemotaxis response regulator CheY